MKSQRGWLLLVLSLLMCSTFGCGEKPQPLLVTDPAKLRTATRILYRIPRGPLSIAQIFLLLSTVRT